MGHYYPMKTLFFRLAAVVGKRELPDYRVVFCGAFLANGMSSC